MKKQSYHIIFYLWAMVLMTSCAYNKEYFKSFYLTNENNFSELRETYEDMYAANPFSIMFEDKKFKFISFERLTDSVKYVYQFDLSANDFADTLHKYHYKTDEMLRFVSELKHIGCTWITRLDYYEKYKPRYLEFMAVRHKKLNKLLKGERYCTYTFFDRAHPYDDKNRFLDRTDRRGLLMVNNSRIFRIKDSVGYAIVKHYR
ncbi:MAG: hypothetical protein QM727_15355 [Niabella sp.]